MEDQIQTKKCSKCGEVKDLENEFNKRRETKDGFHKECKLCVNKAAREYAEKNKEHQLQYRRRWRKANAEKVKEYQVKWEKANPEKVNGRARQWRKANPEKYRKTYHKWADKNKERIKEWGLRSRNLLTDMFVRNIIKQQINLNFRQITPEMIEAKREQLLFYRELKNLKQEVQNGIA